LAAGIAHVKSAKVESASGPASQLPARLLSRALRRSEVAALSDGRCSGGFTPEATVAARRANAPELSVW
jgi:hypothetical protein